MAHSFSTTSTGSAQVQSRRFLQPATVAVECGAKVLKRGPHLHLKGIDLFHHCRPFLA
ncbi:MAG: hypothetical protein U0637_07295 [Phycisphaerales bacterium]